MFVLKSFEQTAEFEPTNPLQTERIAYTYPGGYKPFFFNQVPNPGTLNGLRGLGLWTDIPSWGQIGLVGAAAAVVGYFGMAKFGDSTVRPLLSKVGINLKGLSAPRRRRKRSR